MMAKSNVSEKVFLKSKHILEEDYYNEYENSRLVNGILYYIFIFIDDTVPPTFDRLTSSQVLPWGAPKERSRFPSSFNIETDIRPGEFVMRTLFAEFTVQVIS